MTENFDEIAELKRAHAALESKVETILPTLATKADLEAMGRHLIEEMSHRFDEVAHRFEEMNRSMTEQFNRIWLWIAGTLVVVLVAILGSSWFSRPQPAPAPQPPVIYQLYPPGYTAVPVPQLAPPSQP